LGIPEILATIDHEIAQLQRARALLTDGTARTAKTRSGRPEKATPAVGPPAKPVKKKRKLSPEGRKRIVEAVKRRWAAQKKAAAGK
jgi:hypothetical protein